MSKKVSFIIPCYNHEKYVESCLQSILQQDYRNFEVIIADDGSKDHSVEKVLEMEKEFERECIRFEFLHDGINRGIPKNLNRMLELAQGDYVKIIASDDVLDTTYLSKMVSFMEENPNLMMAFSNGYRVDEDTIFPATEEHFLEPLFREEPDCVNNVLDRVFVSNFVPAPALMVRASLYDEVGRYDEDIQFEDLEMSLRMLKSHPDGLGVLNEPLTFYRVSANSISSNSYNKGVLRRVRFVYENCVKIAKKYRKVVPSDVYRKKMKQLRVDFYYFHVKYALRGIVK